MAKANVYNMAGQQVGEIELSFPYLLRAEIGRASCRERVCKQV